MIQILKPSVHHMISLLLLAATARKPKGQQVYPIIRRQCEVNIFQHTYSFKMLAKKVTTFVKSPYTYYISLCGELEEKDLPNFNHTTFEVKDTQAVRCKLQSGSSDVHVCEVLAYESEFDWKPLNPGNWSQGIIFYAEGEPYPLPNDPTFYETFDFQVNMYCGTDGSTDLKGDLSMEEIPTPNGQTTILTFTVPNSVFGCQQDGPMPSPTPTPYDPECNFTDIFPDMAGYGVDFSLRDMNGFPYGTRTPLIINGEEKILFYQPCERIECPPGYSCEPELPYNFSSAWLCDVQKNKNGIYECNSYGIASTQDKVDMGVIGFEAAPKVYVQHHHPVEQGRSIMLTLTCKQQVPKGHIMFVKDSAKLNGYNLTLEGYSSETCLEPVPTPGPHPPGGPCSFKAESYDKVLSTNLDRYDLNTSISPNAWNKTVKVEGPMGFPESDLYYNPCTGSIQCPNDAFCNGDEFANVLLCYPTTTHPLYKRLCDAYGLNVNSVKMSLYNKNDLSAGFNASYKGDLRKTAIVHYKCDSNLPEHILTLPGSVKLNGLELAFDVYAEDACAADKPDPKPSPTPNPDWYPRYPTQGPTPTPTPLPSPNGLPMFHNETHYIIVNFDQLRQDINRGSTELIAPSISSATKLKTHVEYHPWQLIECPAGYNCLGHDLANLWLCWDEGSNKNVCHASADKRIKNVQLIPLNEKNMDAGTKLIYKGQYGFDLEYSIECDYLESNTSIPWDWATVPIYKIDLQGPQINVHCDSGHVCPKKFEVPNPLPPVTPTPAADPNKKVEFRFKSPIVNNQMIDFDLTKYEDHIEKIAIGYFNHYEWDTIAIYPSKAKECPKYLGFECAGTPGALANAWRCFQDSKGKKVCASLGWANNNLDITLTNESSLYDGVTVNYEGGYQNSQIHFIFQCNESVPGNQIDFNDVAVRYPANPPTTIVFAHTNLVCPVSELRHAVTGGAVALLIFIGVPFLYLVIGVLITFITTGKVAIPHEEFWTEFGQCIITSVLFLGTCGKRRSVNVSYTEI